MSSTPNGGLNLGTIGFDSFPKQGAYKGSRVRVCFNYDSGRTVDGTVLRDDAEEPGRMIIQLDDGRVVLSTECMYQPLRNT